MNRWGGGVINIDGKYPTWQARAEAYLRDPSLEGAYKYLRISSTHVASTCLSAAGDFRFCVMRWPWGSADHLDVEAKFRTFAGLEDYVYCNLEQWT